MLQDHRKSRSRSFLREVEFSTISIKNNEVKNRFLNQFNSINEKRKNPNTIKTGEKYTKTELLTYLKQRGEIKTANIWARSLSYDSNDIKKLLNSIQETLNKEGIEGIVEIHLQDREINSPHIQFIGSKAKEAEYLIAKTLDNTKPYYQLNEKARYPKKDDLNKQIKLHEERKAYQISIEHIEKAILNFNQSLNKAKETLIRKKSIMQLLKQQILRLL